MGSAQTIVAAATATERVQREVLKALNALTSFTSHVNAFGVFTDPLRSSNAFASAREAIERAETVMRDTKWPAPEDYNAA